MLTCGLWFQKWVDTEKIDGALNPSGVVGIGRRAIVWYSLVYQAKSSVHPVSEIRVLIFISITLRSFKIEFQISFYRRQTVGKSMQRIQAF